MHEVDVKKGRLAAPAWADRSDIDLVGADAPTDVLDNEPVCGADTLRLCTGCGAVVADLLLAADAGLCERCLLLKEMSGGE